MLSWRSIYLTPSQLQYILLVCIETCTNRVWYYWFRVSYFVALKHQITIKSPGFLKKPQKFETSLTWFDITEHCRFLVPGNTQKILTEIWHCCVVRVLSNFLYHFSTNDLPYFYLSIKWFPWEVMYVGKFP